MYLRRERGRRCQWRNPRDGRGGKWRADRRHGTARDDARWGVENGAGDALFEFGDRDTHRDRASGAYAAREEVDARGAAGLGEGSVGARRADEC